MDHRTNGQQANETSESRLAVIALVIFAVLFTALITFATLSGLSLLDMFLRR
jgi:hypothetical protein